MESENKSQMTTFLIIIVVLALLISVVIGLYFIYKTTAPANIIPPGPFPVGPSNPLAPIGPSTPPLTPTDPSYPPAGSGHGIWAKISPGHIYNVNYPDAQKLCINNGGIIATKDQLIQANQKGFEYCEAGWLDGQQAGYVVASQQPGCGALGFNQWPGVDPQNTKLISYCYGPIPKTNDIVSFPL